MSTVFESIYLSTYRYTKLCKCSFHYLSSLSVRQPCEEYSMSNHVRCDNSSECSIRYLLGSFDTFVKLILILTSLTNLLGGLAPLGDEEKLRTDCPRQQQRRLIDVPLSGEYHMYVNSSCYTSRPMGLINKTT